MCLMMQFQRLRHVAPRRHRHLRMQHHPREMSPAIRRLSHPAFRMIDVVRHDNPRIRTKMQIRKLMA